MIEEMWYPARQAPKLLAYLERLKFKIHEALQSVAELTSVGPDETQ
jgi:hypothetical protein